MRHLAPFAMFLMLASGCLLVFDGRDDDDVCILAEAEPASLPAPQRNPETLACESFGGGCVPECGPCPAIAELAPQPSWGFCFHTCESLSETDCAKAPECRVVKDAACAIGRDCATDFLGCFPTDQFTRPDVDCFAARDGFTCSQSAACTAYHRGLQGALSQPEILRAFATCAPEGKSPGTCFGQVFCRAAAPACPPNSRPGVADGCYTGGCIPVDVCEPAPPPQ
jgi:hypothetical protein